MYDSLNRPTTIRNGANANISIMAYYDNGQRRWIGHGANGTGYAHDPLGRVVGYNHQRNQAGTIVGDNTSLTYNPASQITQQIRSSDAYAWTGAVNADRAYTTNGLNQYTAAGAATFQYDANGNLVASGATGYLYDAENRLIGSSTGVTLTYDPLGRLFQTATNGSGVTQFLYDGDALVAEYDGAGTLLNRYVHADRVDEPVLWYQGSSTTPRQLMADHQGSIVAVTQHGWSLVGVNTYDEYGIPGAANIGRFQYTGQAWIPELGMYHYKARMYSPTLGRFLQTDPVGYADGLNWYNYVGSDPTNKRDPFGLNQCSDQGRWTLTNGYVFGESVVGPLCGGYYSDFNQNTPSGPSLPTSGDGGGGGGGPTPAPDASPQKQQCGSGGRITIAPFGFGVTGFLLIGGFTAGVEGGISIPLSAFQGNFRGTQLYGSASFVQLLGLGAFVGGGPYAGAGYTPGPISTGSTSWSGASGSQPSLVVQGGAAMAAGAEGQIQLGSSPGVSGGAGPRVGFGAYAAGGVKHSATAATPELCY